MAKSEAKVAEFPQLLAEARVAAGKTQMDLAHDAGLSASYVSALERGVANPTLDVMKRLARVLGTSVGALSGETAA